MKILHVASYYYGSAVYRNLFRELGIVQGGVFVAVRRGGETAHQILQDSPPVSTVASLTIFTRLFYSFKLVTLFFSFYNRLFSLKKEGVDIVHSHTLYADGILGFFYSLILKSEFVVTVRTTDVDFGFKYYFHYKWLAKKALQKAKKIIFVSPAHKVKFQKYFGFEFAHKCIVIPNAIDKFYLERSVPYIKKSRKKNVALYVGAINENKNIRSAIYAYFNNFLSTDAEFRVVGGTYEEYKNVYGTLPTFLERRVFFLGKLCKESVLQQMQLANLFVMVSHSETFGLVYIEAISQCLPIVYTQGQGVDGYFEDGTYGFCANSNDIDSISSAINKTISKFPNGLGPFVDNPATHFSWDRISDVYKEKIYQ